MNKQQLAAKIWASANKMRSKIEPNEYKDYILGFIFTNTSLNRKRSISIRKVPPRKIFLLSLRKMRKFSA